MEDGSLVDTDTEPSFPDNFLPDFSEKKMKNEKFFKAVMYNFSLKCNSNHFHTYHRTTLLLIHDTHQSIAPSGLMSNI